MELVLTRQEGSLVLVTCDGQRSHRFDLISLVSHAKTLPSPIDDPIPYGGALFQALFTPETLARRTLDALPERILLVTDDALLDALPWEYTYGPSGFLVCETPFVRGIAQQRIDPPVLDLPLHIVAIPSNPLEKDLPPLNIDGEWLRLKETIQPLPYQITLERTRPPTIQQVRNQVANQHHRVIHFMGHGGQHEKEGAFLCFEEDNGVLAPVTARQFVLRVRGTVFLVTLNACVSATPGETPFSNLAAALVRQKVPYALGMRLSIHDDDARAFSRTFYGDLARGVPVEEALLQARLTLADSKRPWAVGVPVLYTSLKTAAPGYTCRAGTPTIDEHQPPLNVLSLPRAEGTFQGRIDELRQLGALLTGDSRTRLITIHGTGGQGKTALAREAVERFAYAWPGGVYATTLETLPERELFIADLARFLGIDLTGNADSAESERRVLARLGQQRTLIVLDNAETLVQAINGQDASAIRLAQFLREGLSGTLTSLLVTSREFLGWVGEAGLENDLEGLMPDEGALLFQQSAPQRSLEIDLALAAALSHKVAGHPLSPIHLT
jgi:CHAT domain/AAA domain